MPPKSVPWSDALHAYALATWLRDDAVQARLRAETAALPEAGMQISPEQGQLLAWLVRALGVRRALEIGTFTGYSALCVARALPPDGRLLACDVSQPWTAVARRYWQEAGVAGKIDLRLGAALRTLDALLAAGEAASFDFAFIDADKANYAAYYERCLALVRPGGVIAIDNVLWGGRVADPAAGDADTAAIRALNLALRDDPRIDLALVPVADGLTLARKRPPEAGPS